GVEVYGRDPIRKPLLAFRLAGHAVLLCAEDDGRGRVDPVERVPVTAALLEALTRAGAAAAAGGGANKRPDLEDIRLPAEHRILSDHLGVGPGLRIVVRSQVVLQGSAGLEAAALESAEDERCRRSRHAICDVVQR